MSADRKPAGVAPLYCDTSVVLRAYLSDEDGQEEARAIVFGSDPTVTSELTRVELASGLARARRTGRVTPELIETLIEHFDGQTSPGGPFSLIKMDPGPVLSRAHVLVGAHDLGTLGAIHLAVALLLREAAHAANGGAGAVGFCTRDERQAAAAEVLGLSCR